MCDSPSLSGADTFGLGLTRQRVLNDVVRDGFATGASISDVLGGRLVLFVDLLLAAAYVFVVTAYINLNICKVGDLTSM